MSPAAIRKQLFIGVQWTSYAGTTNLTWWVTHLKWVHILVPLKQGGILKSGLPHLYHSHWTTGCSDAGVLFLAELPSYSSRNFLEFFLRTDIHYEIFQIRKKKYLFHNFCIFNGKLVEFCILISWGVQNGTEECHAITKMIKWTLKLMLSSIAKMFL